MYKNHHHYHQTKTPTMVLATHTKRWTNAAFTYFHIYNYMLVTPLRSHINSYLAQLPCCPRAVWSAWQWSAWQWSVLKAGHTTLVATAQLTTTIPGIPAPSNMSSWLTASLFHCAFQVNLHILFHWYLYLELLTPWMKYRQFTMTWELISFHTNYP